MAKRGHKSREELELQILEAELARRRLMNVWIAFALVAAIGLVLLGVAGVFGHQPEIRLSLAPLLSNGGG